MTSTPRIQLPNADDPSVVNQVWSILTSRPFTHLSRQQSAQYAEAVQASLMRDWRAGHALRFVYDLGPGYHATIQPGTQKLSYVPGLGEWLALRQIQRFSQSVCSIYAPGIHVALMLDNLCAWVTNDIDTTPTEAYGVELWGLVHAAGMADQVSVVCESSVLDRNHYQSAFQALLPATVSCAVTAEDQENVSRFVGYWCSTVETSWRMERYHRALQVSQQLMAPWVSGVRMTQRATSDTFGFRNWPGSDVRLQAGEVAIRVDASGSATPCLLTTRNHHGFQRCALERSDLPPGWPLPLDRVYAVTSVLQR